MAPVPFRFSQTWCLAVAADVGVPGGKPSSVVVSGEIQDFSFLIFRHMRPLHVARPLIAVMVALVHCATGASGFFFESPPTRLASNPWLLALRVAADVIVGLGPIQMVEPERVVDITLVQGRRRVEPEMTEIGKAFNGLPKVLDEI